MPRRATLNAVGRLLDAERRRLGLSVEGLAKRLGKSRRTLHRLMYEEPPRATEDEARRMLNELRAEPRESYMPNPALARRLPPRAYEVVLGHIGEMERAGATTEQIDEAERLMIESNFSKLNKRDPRERTEEDLITDINAAWSAVITVLRAAGLRI